ncbi:hypothetical protein [Streptomyces sp. NPDC002205]|uniref:hypothetical protein n=1 Tax=Streptomyces sp. NPDC002205 TaxID=3154411 RepID=UPI003330CE0A
MPTETSGITPGGLPMSEADWAGLIKGRFREVNNSRVRQITWPDIVSTATTSRACSGR